MTRKAEDFYRRDFIVVCLAICYFRVPEFRKAFLDSVINGKIDEIPEWRDHMWNINEQPITAEDVFGDATIDHFFNWNEYFYNMIADMSECKENRMILDKLLQNKRWEEKIGKRGVAFFLIISKWAQYVQTTVVNNKFLWKNIPGFPTILRVVMTQLKEIHVGEVKDSLIEATSSLLANNRWMVVFIDILFKRTNVHYPSDVKKALDICDRWFQVIGSDGKRFPANFDFAFFFKAIDILLDYEHSITTPKVIWLIYRIFHIFPLEEQAKIADNLFRVRFPSLFLNWSWNIRTVYYKLILFQLKSVYGSDGYSESNFKYDKRLGGTIQATNEDLLHRPAKQNSENARSLTPFASVSKKDGGKSFLESTNQKDEKIIKKLRKIALQVEKNIDDLIASYEENKDNNSSVETPESISVSMDGEDLNEHRKGEKANKILQDIPKKYRPYLPEAIKDFKIEVEDYEKWLKQDKRDVLPEVILAVPLDESENPNTIAKEAF